MFQCHTPEDAARVADQIMNTDMTFFDIEATLEALSEVDPQELTPELREQFELEIREAVAVSAEKRERIAIKLFELGQRAQVKRTAAMAHKVKAQALEESAASYDASAARLKDYVLAVMAGIPKPKRGVRTIEGTSSTFKAKGVPDSLEIIDASLLPDQFRTATVTMPLALYRALDAGAEMSLTQLMRLPVTWGRVEKSIIKAVAETAPVPGTKLITDKLRLEVS